MGGTGIRPNDLWNSAPPVRLRSRFPLQVDVDLSKQSPAKRAKSLQGLGERLKAEREKAGMSQRELARRLSLSPSMISQLEAGQSQPSVGTLWAIVTELDLSLDTIIREDDAPTPAQPLNEGFRLVGPEDRQAIDLASGVRWEDLAASSDEPVDFVLATYEVGGASTPDGSLMRHHGWEYGYVISGTLRVQLGFFDYELRPGDSISYDSTRPHRLSNDGDIPVQAIWFVVDRDAEDTARFD